MAYWITFDEAERERVHREIDELLAIAGRAMLPRYWEKRGSRLPERGPLRVPGKSQTVVPPAEQERWSRICKDVDRLFGEEADQ